MTVKLRTQAEMLAFLKKVILDIAASDADQSRADMLERLTGVDPMDPGFYILQSAVIATAKDKRIVFADAFILGAAAADAFLRSKGLIQ